MNHDIENDRLIHHFQGGLGGGAASGSPISKSLMMKYNLSACFAFLLNNRRKTI
jgi:hypothetical protein